MEIGGQTITVKVVDICSNCDGKVGGQAIYSKGLIEIKHDPSFKCFGA